MDEFVVALITSVIVGGVAAVVICVLTLLHKKEKQRWEKIAEDSYNRGKDDASDIVKSTYDQIESDKEKLCQLTDRELLIETMLALGSYGRRIDRVDEKLKCITNYKAYIDSMNTQTQALSHNFVLLEGNISATSSVITGLRQTVQETSSNIHRLITDLSDLKNLHSTLNNHVESLHKVESSLELLQRKIAYVVDEMDAVMSTCDQSPMKKLKTIETDIGEMNSLIGNLKNNVDNINNTTDDVLSAVGSVCGMLSISLNPENNESLYKEIYDAQKYLYDNISYLDTKLNNIKHKLDKSLEYIEFQVSHIDF